MSSRVSVERGKVIGLPSTKPPNNTADEVRPDDQVEWAEAASPENRVIFVLGMHRTGTSAVTRILMNLGYALPSDPVAPDKDNPKGYWEPRGIVETHEEFLQAIGRTWSDPRPLPEQCFLGEPADKARKRLAQQMDGCLKNHGRWISKDPRMCRLLPLWRPLLNRERSDIQFLFVLRSPLSVAESLAKRDDFSKGKSLLLWLRHYLEAESLTRDWPRAWLTFERLHSAPVEEMMEPVSAVVGQATLRAGRLAEAAESAFDGSLVHHSWDWEKTIEELQAYPWVSKAFQSLALLGTSREEDARRDLDDLSVEIRGADRLQFEEVRTLYAGIHGERYFWLRQEIEHYHRAVEAQRNEMAEQRNEVVKFHRSIRRGLTAQGAKVEAVSDRLSTVEKLLTGRFEQRHLALLNKSLDLSARIESQWASARDQLDKLVREVGGRANLDGVGVLQGEGAISQFRTTKAELETIGAELGTAKRERDELRRSKSWRYTAFLRTLLKPIEAFLSRS